MYNPLIPLRYVFTLCFIRGRMATLFESIIKATIFMTYSDDSYIFFEFSCDAPERDALALLMMVTRGTLMASIANSICAYDDQGFEICAYVK